MCSNKFSTRNTSILGRPFAKYENGKENQIIEFDFISQIKCIHVAFQQLATVSQHTTNEWARPHPYCSVSNSIESSQIDSVSVYAHIAIRFMRANEMV